MLAMQGIAAVVSFVALPAPLVNAMQIDGVQELAWGDWGCPCVGIDGTTGDVNLTINGVLVSYPANFGTSCEAWDDGRYPAACESGGKPGKGKGFCAEKWCYVDPCTCDSKESRKAQYGSLSSTYKDRPLYYSYATCGSKDLLTEPQPEEQLLIQQRGQYMQVEAHEPLKGDGDSKEVDDAAASNDSHPAKLSAAEKERMDMCHTPPESETTGKSGCHCIGIHHKGDKTHVEVSVANATVKYPVDIGNYCRAWDKDVHPACSPDSGYKTTPKWCEASWCYVDPCTCSMKNVKVSDDSAYLPKWSFEGNQLFYSYKACGSDDTWTPSNNQDSCTNKEESECNGDCTWSKKEGQTESKCRDKVTSKYCERKLQRVEARKKGDDESIEEEEEEQGNFWSKIFR